MLREYPSAFSNGRRKVTEPQASICLRNRTLENKLMRDDKNLRKYS